ncbi:MAG: hypothetical protein ACK5XA_08470 [Tagaea sp.]
MTRAHAVRWLGARRADLESQARLAGLELRTWSPGTGSTHYRLFPAGYAGPYHSVGWIHECLGIGEARQFIVSRIDAAGRRLIVSQ